MPNIDTLTITFGSKGTENAVKNIKSMASAVRVLSGSLRMMDMSKIGDFSSGMEALKKSVPTSSQTNRMVDFADAVSKLSAAIGASNISGFSNDMSNLGTAVQLFKKSSVNSITNAVAAMETMKQQAESTANAINNATPKNSQNQGVNNSTDTLTNTKQIIASLDKVQVKATGVKSVLQKMGLGVPTKAFKTLEENAEKVRLKYEEVRKALQKGLDTQTITSDSAEYKKKMAELEGLRNKYEELILKQRQLAQEGGGFQLNINVSKAFQGLSQAIGGVKQSFSGVSSIVQAVNKQIDTFIGKVRGLRHSTRKTQNDTKTMIETVKKLGNEITRVSKMLKLMVTRMALRKVIAEVGDGFKSLAVHSDEFNNSVSTLMNAAKKLGYSFSAMVSPIINALAPAISFIIGLFTKLANIINQVFSALTGKSTWNKAKDFTDSWRDSFEDTADAVKETEKEIKKTVLGFDELNQLVDNTEKETSNKNKDNGGIADMYDTMPIEQKWKDLADYIKSLAQRLFEPIKKAWEKVGDFVKKSWKYAMDELLKLGKSVARDFWKVWEQADTQKIFENIFEIIGWIGVAVGNLARQLRKAWDFNDTGLHILENIRDIILIITEHLKNMAKATAEWAGKLNFIPLFTSIEKWLQSLEPAVDAVMGILEDFYTQVVLKFTKWVIESGLPALIDVFTRFNEEVKWDLLRERLSKLWEHLEPFMETVGEGLIIFIERITKAVAEFINGDTFADFLEWFGEWMDSVTPNDVADTIEKIVIAIAGFKALGIVISIATGIATGISGIITVCKGISTVASGISGLVAALGGFSGIAVVAVVIAAIAVAMYSFVQSYGGFEGAAAKLTSVVDDIKTSFTNLYDSLDISEKIDEVKESIEDFIKQLGDMHYTWEVLFAIIEGIAKLISGYVLPLFDDALTNIKNIIDTITGYMDIIESVLKMMVGLFTKDKELAIQGAKEWSEGVNKEFGNGLNLLEGLVDGFTDGLGAPFRALQYLITDDIPDVTNAISESYEKCTESAKPFAEVTNDIANKSVEASEKIKDAKSTTDGLSKELSNASEKMSGLVKSTDEGTKSTSKWVDEHRKSNQAWNDLKNTTSQATDTTKKGKEAIDAATASIEKNTGAIPKFTKEQQNIIDSFKDVSTEGTDLAKTLNENFESIFDDSKVVTEDIPNDVSNASKEIIGVEQELSKTTDDTMRDIKKSVEDNMNEVDKTFETIKKGMTKEQWTFQGVADGLGETFRRAKEAIKREWNEIAETLNGEHEVASETIKIDLPKFARGGFPEDGLFYANHNELVGSFNNGRTAVANNTQIVEGISSGVYGAVAKAMAQNNGNGKYISNTIVVDGEVIARTVTKAQDRQNMRFSPTMG